MKVNSKNKGSRFERAICKWFSEWTGYEFSRVPASGGLRWKKTDNITSDITCTDPKHSRKFPFSIECKNYQDIKFEHTLLGNKGCKIRSFWDQAVNDANRGNKVPILVMKYNNMPKGEAFMMVDHCTGKWLSSKNKNLKYWYIHTEDLDTYVFMLSEIKGLEYKAFYKFTKDRIKKK